MIWNHPAITLSDHAPQITECPGNTNVSIFTPQKFIVAAPAPPPVDCLDFLRDDHTDNRGISINPQQPNIYIITLFCCHHHYMTCLLKQSLAAHSQLAKIFWPVRVHYDVGLVYLRCLEQYWAIRTIRNMPYDWHGQIVECISVAVEYCKVSGMARTEGRRDMGRNTVMRTYQP